MDNAKCYEVTLKIKVKTNQLKTAQEVLNFNGDIVTDFNGTEYYANWDRSLSTCVEIPKWD